MIAMTDINDVLRELNVLNSKESKNNISKLINLIKIDQKTNKPVVFNVSFFNLMK